jgi:hypothetical protein
MRRIVIAESALACGRNRPHRLHGIDDETIRSACIGARHVLPPSV